MSVFERVASATNDKPPIAKLAGRFGARFFMAA